ncbi:tRNA dimethylallyltransferase [Oxobacter pfennigii]|uniref:tRNA dimethylallyltransferase n=1 Tax=Oxobacter pfennigii TaxID=36849 RepID=A0A0P8YYI2_9CLOT|nr:tRNA (adenosine(37)-N6)-dimethylallyltransferase MiaA [Oxobacter pfennigii]KPU44846.1 tRNA dimethylallyltransferase [Oxobacter pfennigii]
MKKPLFILVGPTAVGKTEISIKLAKVFKSEIISADSMLVYKYMDIGTAKPTPKEMDGVRHHLIDVVNPDEEFSVALFREKAVKHIDDLISSNKLPIVAGGTGLYINSLTYALDFTETISDWDYRNSLLDMAKEKGNAYVHNMLKAVDIDSFNRLHENDLKRIIRALEVYKYTGKTITEVQIGSRKKAIDYDLCMIGLISDRQKLYEKINKRVDIMLEKGLVNEVKSLLDMGYTKDLTSMQGLGYKEIISFLEGEYSFEEAVYRLKQSTRHFAKRQLTWFRREERIHWVNVDEYEDTDSIVQNIAHHVAGKLS